MVGIGTSWKRVDRFGANGGARVCDRGGRAGDRRSVLPSGVFWWRGL